MNRVAPALLLGLCLAVTSHAQIGIHLKSNGYVGICDDTPFTHFTVSGPIGFNSGDYPMHYMFENDSGHNMKPVFVHSPVLSNTGMFFDDSGDKFKFGTTHGQGIWLGTTTAALSIGYSNPYNGLIIAGDTMKTATLRIGNRSGFDYKNSGMIIFDEDINAATGPANFCGMALRYNGISNQLSSTRSWNRHMMIRICKM